MRRVLLLGGALVLATPACGSSGHHTTDPTTLPAPTTQLAPTTTTPAPTTSSLPAPTTTTVPSPTNIPAKITVSYVNAVLAQLNHVYGDAERIELETKNLPRSVPALLRAIYLDPQYGRELYVFSEGLLSPQLSQAKAHPGDRVSVVTSLLSESSSCVDLKTQTSYAAVVSPPPPEEALYFVLRLQNSANDPAKANHTPWSIYYEMSAKPRGTDAC